MFSKTRKNAVDKLAEKIWAKRPILKNIIDKFGSLSLAEYYASFAKPYKTVSDSLKREFAGGVGRIGQSLFGQASAAEIQEDVLNHYYALTADHHGPLTHPFFLSSALLAAAANRGQKNLLVLSTGSISLNNSSHPRGLLYHSQNKLVKLNLVSAKHHMQSVYSTPAFGERELTGLDKEINNLPERRGLGQLRQILHAPAILEQKRFGNQISLLNRQLGNIFFSGQTLPQLAYIELELVAADLILHHHLNSATLIHQIIFEEEYRNKFHQNFRGIPGSFDKDSGTFLFWFLPKEHPIRVGLQLEKNYLISADKKFKIELSEDNIKDALGRGELMPNTILSLLLLSAYYGVKALGGFNQTTYLTDAQTVYNKIFLHQPADLPEHTQTLGAEVTALYAQINGRLEPATGLDLILYSDSASWDNFQQTSSALTLKEALWGNLPLIYPALYPAAERTPQLHAITSADILQADGFRSKIQPVVKL
jgi:hypothetical protein